MTLILSGTDGLSDVDGSAATPAIRGTDANTGIFFPAADTIAFTEGGTEAMRLDSAGNMGLGVTPSAWKSNYKATQVGNATAVVGRTDSNNNYFSSNWFVNSSNQDIYQNTGFATIYSQGTGTHIWYNAPSGTAGNAISFTQAMTLDANGRLFVNTTTEPGSNDSVVVIKAGGTSKSRCLSLEAVTTGSVIVQTFRNPNGQVGHIETNASATAYITSSDYRLKEDVQPMTGALAKVALLKPVTYKWKVDGSDGQGFIAHELQEVVPDAVSGAKDVTEIQQYEITPAVKDEEGRVVTAAVMGTRIAPVYQGIDTSFLVATLTAAIQEQQALIAALTNRITALEAK